MIANHLEASRIHSSKSGNPWWHVVEGSTNGILSELPNILKHGILSNIHTSSSVGLLISLCETSMQRLNWETSLGFRELCAVYYEIVSTCGNNFGHDIGDVDMGIPDDSKRDGKIDDADPDAEMSVDDNTDFTVPHADSGRKSIVWNRCTTHYLYEVTAASIAASEYPTKIQERWGWAWGKDETRELAKRVPRLLGKYWAIEHSDFGDDHDPATLVCELIAYIAGSKKGTQRFGHIADGTNFVDAAAALNYLTSTLHKHLCRAYGQQKDAFTERKKIAGALGAFPFDDDKGVCDTEVNIEDEQTSASDSGSTTTYPAEVPDVAGISEPLTQRLNDSELINYLKERIEGVDLKTAAGQYPPGFIFYFDESEQEFEWAQVEKDKSAARREEILEILGDYLGQALDRFPGKQQYVRAKLTRHFRDYVIPEAFANGDANEYVRVSTLRDKAFEELERALKKEFGITKESRDE